MKVSLQQKVAIGYVLTTLVMLSILIGEFRYIKSLQKDAEAIDQTHQVKEHLDYLLSLVKDTETGARGYLITGQPEFLDTYEVARIEVPAEIERIKDLISDSEGEQERLRSMEKLIDRKLFLQSEVIRLRKEKSPETAAALIATGEGTQIMEDLLRLSKEMGQAEVGMLAARISRKRQTASRAFVLSAVVVALNLFVFTFLFLLIRREIKQRERAEHTLRRSEEKFKALVQNAGDVIYSTDVNGNFTFVNPTIKRVMGYEPEELLGRHYLELVAPSFREEVQQFYRQQITGLVPTSFHQHQVVRKDGSEMWIGQTLELIFEAKKILGVAAVARDVTQSKELQDELAHARDAALESTRIKSEFLANMSHEIRTPMNGIIGMTSLLSGTELDQDQRHFVDGIRQSADSLLGVINDILDFSRLEAGKVQISPADFDLRVLIDEVITLFSEPAESKNLELIAVIEPDVPVFLRADPSRVRQVLINLLGNAIKFTSQGEVTLGVECLWESATDTVLRFNVKDTGVGISEEGLSRIFNAFVQADGSTARRYGGSGLGLAISKQLVEAMGGKIGVESRVGQGSTFWFTLNAERQVSKSASELSLRTDLQGLRALVVDDRPSNREALNKQLTSWRLEVSAADGFDEAFNALRGAGNSGRPIHMALIDHEIKGGAGVDLARAIMRDSHLTDVRVILLSTFGQRPSERVIADAGVRATLIKPIRQSQLYDCLVNVMSDQFPGKYDTTPEQSISIEQPLVSLAGGKKAARAVSEAKLLVVEDNPINQEVARYQVEKIGYRADVARDGVEALAMLDHSDYALILMDCHMPGMDGFETTARIRSRTDSKRRMPIIAVTASASAEEKQKCLQAGMDDFLAKPFHQQELAAKIANWISRDSPVARSGDGATGELAPQAANDVTRGLKQLEEDYGQEMVLKIVQMIIPDSEKRIEIINRAIKDEDFKALEEAAHGLKSAAANIGAAGMAQLCEQLERQGELGSIGNAKELMKQLTNSWAEVRSLIEKYH